MALPMGIAEARALTKADLDVGDDAIAIAEAEAQEAADLVAALERAAIEGDKKPTNGAAAAEAKQLADFAVKRSARTRALADRAKAARRLLDLEQVGADVARIAADAAKPSQSIAAAIQQIADGRADLMRLCAEHDGQVIALINRASALGVEKPAPNGPRASSAHVAILGNGITSRSGIQSGAAAVRRTDAKTAAEAAQLAASGKPEGALTELQAARTVPAPQRYDRYYQLANGRVEGITGDTPTARSMAAQAAKGEIRELAPDEVAAYLEGRFDGHRSTGPAAG